MFSTYISKKSYIIIPPMIKSQNFFLETRFICLFIWGVEGAHAIVHTWRTEDSLRELVLSFCYVSSRDHTQVIKLDKNLTYPLSNLIGPEFLYMTHLQHTELGSCRIKICEELWNRKKWNSLLAKHAARVQIWPLGAELHAWWSFMTQQPGEQQCRGGTPRVSDTFTNY